MRQKGRMEMNAMFSLLSFLYLKNLLNILVHVSHLRQKKFASTKLLVITWFRTVFSIQLLKTLIIERKCHSVADLRERSPPPLRGGGGSGRFPVKKR